VLRGALLAIPVSMLFFFKDLGEHFYAHFTGSIIGTVMVGQWHVVAFNIALFLSFLVPLAFRRKVDWKEYGLVTAFFISLFIEMYGIPLTIMLASGAMDTTPIEGLRIVLVIPFLGVRFAFSVGMVYGSVLILAGTALVVAGWVTLYRHIKRDALVTTGIYSVSRNPQYLGFVLVIVGWFVGWPTLLTTIFAPILVFMYVRLCRKEEDEIRHLPGFKRYKKSVPLIV